MGRGLGILLGLAGCASGLETRVQSGVDGAAESPPAVGLDSGVGADVAGAEAYRDGPRNAVPDTREAELGPYTGEDKANLLVYRDGDGKLKPVADAVTWEKRRANILNNMQLVMGQLPGPSRLVPPDVKIVEESMITKDMIDKYNVAFGQTAVINYAVVRKKITIAVEKGDRLPAYVLIPQGLAGKTAGVLCLHHTTPPDVGKRATAGVQPSVATGLELAARGYVTIVPDYPRYCDYMNVDPDKLGYASTMMKGVWNHMRAIDVLAALPEVDGERIGVIGFSLGGHNSLLVAAFDRRIKAIVSSSGFNSFYKYYGGDLSNWCLPHAIPRICSMYGGDPARVPFDFTEVAGTLAPRPFFAHAPAQDHNFEVSGVRDCIGAAQPVYDLLGARSNLVVLYPDADHGFPSAYREQAYRFLDQALGRN